MANRKKEMYNWDKFSKTRVYSRSQRLASDNDIQDWIKTVEDASSKAAVATFGSKYGNDSVPRGRAAVKATVADVHLHDAAYAEAQDLLQNWVDTKLDFDSEMDFSEENWNKKTQADIKREWDHLLGEDEPEEEVEEVDYLAKYGLKSNNNTSRYGKDTGRDPYSILDADEGSMVGSILQGLMDKEVIPDHVTKDLDLDDSRRKPVDPRTKMELRRQQVKENKEKRMKEKEKQLREKQSKKDSQFRARQIVQKEEQGKKIKKQREEMEIQKEMARIKKEMEEDRRKREEQIQREKYEKEVLAQKAQEEYERQTIEEHKTQMRSHHAAEERKRQIMKRMEELDKREALENLKLLQRTFSVWYNIVIQRRMQLGKAKAMSDWKILLRTFNSWKSFVRSKHVDKQTYEHEYHMKVQQRNKIVSANHWRQKLLQKCLTAWQLYVTMEQSKKVMDNTKKQTQNKMAAFLEAAKRGKLHGGKNEEESSSMRRSISLEDLEGGDTTRRKVDDLFGESPKKKGGGFQSARSDASSNQNTARSRSRSRGRSNKQQPLQAWQVNKKHIKLIGQGDGDGKDTTRSNVSTDDGVSQDGQTAKGKSKPWEKSPFIVNNLENRHKAQQQILENQQKQLKEQHRIIEELQYLQKQQLLHQQITTQQLLGQKVNNVNMEGQVTETPAKLQEHLNNLQRQLVEVEGVTGQQVNTDRSEVSELMTPMTPITPLTPRSGFTNGVETARTEATNQTDRSGVSMATKASSAASTMVNSRHEKFLQSMGQRAGERARIKKEREEKRRKEEEERLAQLEAAAEELRQKEQDEKRRKAEQYREKKRLEKQREIDRQQQAERMRELSVMAEEHYRLSLLKYRGLNPLGKLVSMSRDNQERAEKQFTNTLLRKCLLSWHLSVQTELREKRAMADDMYNYIIVKRSFTRWQHFGEYMNILELRAVKFYETKIKTKILRELGDNAASEKVAGWHNERKAKEHNLLRLQKRTFQAWRSYPEFLRDEAERDKRRLEMRKKVASLIPDFAASVDKSSDSIL